MVAEYNIVDGTERSKRFHYTQELIIISTSERFKTGF